MKRNRLAGGNLRLRILLVFMLLLSATHVSATEKVLLENWSLLEQEDKAVGLSFDRYLQTEEGFLYTSNIVLRMGILGGPAQELKIYAELLVDGDYLARSYRLISELGGKQSEVLGVITGNQVTITVTDHDGAEYSSFFSEEGNGLLYFKDSFLDGVVRAEGLKVGERHTARVWDYGSNRFADFTFRVEEKTTYDYGGEYVEVFSIIEEEPGQNTWLVSESGDLYRSYDPVEKLGARKVEKEDIPELSAYSLDVLLVPGNVRVAHPFRSVRSVIRVTGKMLTLPTSTGLTTARDSSATLKRSGPTRLSWKSNVTCGTSPDGQPCRSQIVSLLLISLKLVSSRPLFRN
jgi:hypothetical protein